MPSNFPPGYSEDGDATNHGSQTEIYQVLTEIRRRYEKWVCENGPDFPNDEFKKMSDLIEDTFQKMEADLNQPL